MLQTPSLLSSSYWHKGSVLIIMVGKVGCRSNCKDSSWDVQAISLPLVQRWLYFQGRTQEFEKGGSSNTKVPKSVLPQLAADQNLSLEKSK